MTAPQHVFVTGGAGFVGSHLVDRLIANGTRVTVLDNLSSGCRENVNPQAMLVVGDIRDKPLVEKLVQGADAVFHLAAVASVPQCESAPEESHAVNMTAFGDLLDAVARRANGVIPVVYASSAAVYGDTRVFPLHERLPPSPLSIYGRDKAGCEELARDAGKRGVPTFGVRPFNIYGPRQNPSSPYSGVISIFVDRLRNNRTLTIFGDGTQKRDFIYVSDIVDGLMSAMEKASTQAPVCNLATGKETSILDVAKHLASILDRTPAFAFEPPRAGDIYRSVADVSLASSLLGFKAKTDIADGLLFTRKLA